jgi:homoserine O-acetyltransferase
MLVACSTDRYFSPEDNKQEAQHLRTCELRIFDSPFGHCAFSPGKVLKAMQYLNDCIAAILEC